MEKNEDVKVFTCENCGGIMAFDIGRQVFRCENCGTVVELHERDDAGVTEHDFQTYLDGHVDDAWNETTEVQRCESCGAEIVVEKNATTANCAFCGSAHVLKAKQSAGIAPEAIVPFRVDKAKVHELFQKWVRKKWFAPRALKNLYQQNRLRAVYLPYWTYDADAVGHYYGEGGEVYYITVERDGKKMQQRRVRWYPVSGTVNHFFDDVLVSAMEKEEPLVQKTGSFAVRECVPFDMAYLSGFQAEKYTRGLQQGYDIAQQSMHGELRSMAHAQILRRYDEARVHKLDARFFNIKFKHIFLPIWMSGYYYKDRLYHFIVNGQTGRVAGEYPKSKVKIAIVAAAAALLAAALIYWFSQG